MLLCPAPAKDRRSNERAHLHVWSRDRTCDRVLGEVGAGLVQHIRVHSDGKTGRARAGTSCRCCPLCGTMLEFLEERIP